MSESPGRRASWRTLHLTAAEGVAVVTYAAIALLTSLQVFCRYVVGSALPWTEEMARYCFIWLIYVGMVLSLNRGAHASTDILGLFLTGRAKKTVQLAVHCMAVALFAVLFFQGVGLVRMVGGQVSPAMRISIMIPYAALPFGSALMIIEELRIMAGIARRNDREERQ